MDAVKWTDVGTFWATAVQAVVVVIALIVAYVQYKSALRSGRVQLTNDMIKELTSPDMRSAIDRTSANLDYHDDWPDLTVDLRRPGDDPRRMQRESDLFDIANLYSKLAHLYNGNLIDRTMFVSEYGEYTLFICGAVSGVFTVYTQPDYRGLFELARICQGDYRQRGGRYALLRELTIPTDETGRGRPGG